MEACPSNIELSQFQARFVELFENMNFRTDENRKYISLFNTVMDTKKLFLQQCNYLKEINDTYKQAGQKKAKEVLLHNIKNILSFLQVNVLKATEDLN